MKVAMIGLGRMGAGIGRRIAERHKDTSVFDLVTEKTESFRGIARPARSARDASSGAQVAVLSLLDDNSVLSMLEDENGVLAGLDADGIVLNATTISADASLEAERRCNSVGRVFLAGPVLGRPDAAATGGLMSLVGGDNDGYQHALPVLQAYTHSQYYVGADVSAAVRSKLLVNYMAASLIDLMGQTFAFAERAKIDTNVIADIIRVMLPNQPFDSYSQRIRTRNFDDPGFTLRLGLKDLDLMLRMSSEVGAPLPNAGPIHDRMLTAMAHGYSDRDWCVWTESSRMAAGASPPSESDIIKVD